MKPDAHARFEDDPTHDAALGAPLVALWHAILAVAVALTALAAQMMDGLKDAPLAALLLMAFPGVFGVVLMVRDSVGLRLAVIGGWILAATASAVSPAANGASAQHGMRCGGVSPAGGGATRSKFSGKERPPRYL